MKKLLFILFLFQTFATNIKSRIIQAHYLKKEETPVILYGDTHLWDKEIIEEQAKLIEEQILSQPNVSIITEKPLTEKPDVLSTIPIFYFLVEKSKMNKNIICIESRTFLETYSIIEDALHAFDYHTETGSLEEFKQSGRVKNQPNLQKTFLVFLSEIETILKDLATEFFETLDTTVLSDKSKQILIENFIETKKNILDFINNWNQTFEQNNLLTKPIIEIMTGSFNLEEKPEIELIKKMNSKIVSATCAILDFKLLIEVIKQFKTNKKIAVFAGCNHIDNLIKILESTGFTIQEEKRNPHKPGVWVEPVDTQTFGWITN